MNRTTASRLAAVTIQIGLRLVVFQANRKRKLNQWLLLVPTANCEHLDSDCDLDIVKGKARRTTVNCILLNVRGLGAGCGSLVLQRAHE
jgi:hypothetical protein